MKDKPMQFSPKLPLVSFVSCVALISLSACSRPTADRQANRPPGPVAVRTVAVQSTDIVRTTRQPATLHAFYEAHIHAKASGYVHGLDADLGDRVAAGQVLATIDVPLLDQQKRIIEATVKRLIAEQQKAEASVQLTEAQADAARAMLAEAKSQTEQIEASVAAAESEFSRTEDLVNRGSLQDRMLDEVRQRRDAQLASRAAAESSVQSAAAGVEVAEAQIASAEAGLIAAKADTDVARRQLDEVQVRIEYATLRAPFDGIITDRQIEPGNLVTGEQTNDAALFVISQVDRLRVRIPVPESDAPMIQPGDVIELTFPSVANQSAIRTVVTRRAGSLDPSTRTMMVEAELDNPDGNLLPGMFGQALIRTTTESAANILPAAAIRFNDTGDAYVYSLDNENLVSITSITTGIDNGNIIEVTSGLSSGQRVVGPHRSRFVDGQKVRTL